MKRVIFIVLLLTGCGSAAPSVTGVDNGSPGGSSSSGSSTDVKAIVTQGENMSFNHRTGGVNDMGLNPSTNLPAIAYHDQDMVGGGTGATPTTGGLKYAYMDSNGNWNIEVVDVSYGTTACGAASSFCFGAPNAAANLAQTIKLAFKSDGRPAIAYVFGASLTGPGDKEIRFAERSSAGVWTIQRAFTSTIGSGAGAVSTTATVNPFSGLTLLFDSSNRPHITVALYASTILSSTIKYFFRNTAGTWSSRDIMNAVAGATATVTATTGALQAGAAWCSAGSNSTSGAAAGVYMYQRVRGTGGHGNPVFINCTNVSSDGECTAWNTLDLVNGCAGASCSATLTTGADNGVVGTNAGSRADMVIDSSTNKPVIAFYSTATPNTQILQVTAPSACNAAQSSTAASWGAFNAVDTTASAGANGLKINMRNTSNLFVSYILATATVRQTKSTNGGTAWFATGHIIETPAVAFGTHGIGSAYDGTNDVLYVSYPTGGAANAIGNDIRMAYVDPDDLQSAGVAGAAHAIDTIDQTGNAFPAPVAAAPPLLSAAKAANGTVGYAYYYHDNNGVFADSKLYYGVRGGTATSPVFTSKFVTNHQESSSATAAIGLNPSLAYDSSSNPIIAFYNGTATEVSLNMARSGNGGANFAVSVVDDTSADIGRFPSVATYSSAIGVAYRDETNTALKFARWTSTGQWKRFVVDGMAGAGGSGCAVANASGQYAKMVVTSTGRPVIVYQDDTGASSLLRIAIAAEAINNSAGSFTWTCLTLDSGSASATGFGEGIDIALDSSDKPHIVHFNFSTGDYRYLYSTSAVGTAISTGSSAFTAAIITNVTSPSLAAGNSIPSIKINSSGTVYVALHDVQNRALVLGSKSSSGSTFTLEQIEQAPNLGGITTPYAGQFPVLLLNSSSLPMIFYRSWENWVRYFSRESS